MRNALRVLAFDIAAPLAAIAAVVTIGLALEWRPWWIAVCAILCLLVVEGMVANFWLARRDKVTVGTDDDGPRLRFAVVGLATIALAAATAVAYTQWRVPDRERAEDMDNAVLVASDFSEAVMTFSPQDPMGSVNRAADLMDPERAQKFRDTSSSTMAAEAAKNVSTRAQTMSAGVEVISPDAAGVAVVLRATRNVPDKPQDRAVISLRVAMTKIDGQWKVIDFTPIGPVPEEPPKPDGG